MYGDEYQQLGGRPLKGGGGPKGGSGEPWKVGAWVLQKLLLPLLRALRAGAKSWITSLAGVGLILQGVFGGGDVDALAVETGIALIFARDAGKSSQDSGIRPEVIE